MCLRGDQAARKLTPQIEAYVRARWPDLSRAGTYGIRQTAAPRIESIFAVELCQETLRPLAGGVKASSGARHAGEAGGVGVGTNQQQPQMVSRTLGKTSLEINGLALRARRPIAIVDPEIPGQPPGPSTSAGSNTKKDPSGVNETNGCYIRLEEAVPKELNLRLIFTLRPDFSEVCKMVPGEHD